MEENVFVYLVPAQPFPPLQNASSPDPCRETGSVRLDQSTLEIRMNMKLDNFIFQLTEEAHWKGEK